MKDGFWILQADSGMIGQIADIERASFFDPWRESDLSGTLSNPAMTLLAAQDANERVYGYLIGSLLPPEAEIWRIAVRPDCRREGIGRELIGAFLEKGRKIGCDRCFLEVRAGNRAARALYAACGFAERGVRKDYYRNPREDAILMDQYENEREREFQ